MAQQSASGLNVKPEIFVMISLAQLNALKFLFVNFTLLV